MFYVIVIFVIFKILLEENLKKKHFVFKTLNLLSPQFQF